MIDEDLLDSDEAEEFILNYLLPEIDRHAKLRDEALTNAKQEIQSTILYLVWSISALRHQQDISFTYAGVLKLSKKFDLDLKFVPFTKIRWWLNYQSNKSDEI